MSDTRIEWADKSWSPITGCTRISEGCQNCYAERMSKRMAGRYGYDKNDPFKVTLHWDKMDEPLHWRRPSRIFVCSMGDLFHDSLSTMAIINCLSVMAAASRHTFLILTKRPERMKKIFTSPTIANDVWLQTSRGVNCEKSPWPLPNVMLGVTAENQQRAEERIPILLQTPAAKRFVSVEPMLGAADINRWLKETCTQCGGIGRVPNHPHIRPHQCPRCKGSGKVFNPRLDWVICGGETGPGARPMNPDWVRSLRDQCLAAGTPFFFKSWGDWFPRDQWEYNPDLILPDDDEAYINSANTHVFNCTTGVLYPVHRVGKKAAGRLLDGRTWNEWPEVTP